MEQLGINLFGFDIENFQGLDPEIAEQFKKYLEAPDIMGEQFGKFLEDIMGYN